MAHFSDQDVWPVTAASAIGAYLPVRGLGGASSVDERVIGAASVNEEVVGFTIATVATGGDPAQVAFRGKVKAIALASLGAWANVGVASTNGKLGPIAVGGLSTALGSALGAAGLRFQVGIALEAAAAGDVFTVLLRPCEVV